MKLLFDKSVKHYSLEANEYTYGRLCARIAHLLMGKDDFCRYFNKPRNVVVVKNIYTVNFSGKGKTDKMIHYHHSGYMGGLKKVSIQRNIDHGLLENSVRRSVGRMMSKSTHFKKLVKLNIVFQNDK